MKSARVKRLSQMVLASLVALAPTQFGCNGSSGVYKPGGTFLYRFEGVLVKDVNTDFTHIVARLTRNDSIRSEAVIRFGGDSLAYSVDSTYYRVVLPAGDYPAGNYDIKIHDSSDFHDTLTTVLAGDFFITSIAPPRREKLSFETVQLEWSGSANAQGYVIAAVKRDSIYAGLGYSQYVTSQATSGTFNNDAFSLTGNVPDTGWYYLYVYAYIGAPDSAQSAGLLPAPVPSQLSDNISVMDLGGRFGTIVVAGYDSMHVVTSK